GRSSLSNYAAGEVARLLFTTKAKLVSTMPQVGSVEAPDTDKGAALPVHPGAAAYFDGEQTSLLERYESVLYLSIFLMSLIGSGYARIRSARRSDGPREDREQMPQEQLANFEHTASTRAATHDHPRHK